MGPPGRDGMVRTYVVIIVALFFILHPRVGSHLLDPRKGGPDSRDAQLVTTRSPTTAARVWSGWQMRYEITEAREPGVWLSHTGWGPGESQNRKPSQHQLMENRRDMRRHRCLDKNRNQRWFPTSVFSRPRSSLERAFSTLYVSLQYYRITGWCHKLS